MTTPDAVPPADAAEQAQEVVPEPPGSEPAGPDLPLEAPLEADAADAAEQAAEVPLDEDEAPS